jgi:hypothetical protein
MNISVLIEPSRIGSPLMPPVLVALFLTLHRLIVRLDSHIVGVSQVSLTEKTLRLRMACLKCVSVQDFPMF